MAGYSQTPLARKLGLKAGFKIILHDVPAHYFELFIDFPEDVEVLEAIASQSADFIHMFVTQKEELAKFAAQYKTALKKTGMLWISWPKGSSKISTNLKRDPIREYMLSLGLVDVKVAAVDQNWSGLKFMYRVKDR